jgi:signal transduction histidine kinase
MLTGLARTTLAVSPERAEHALARAQEATRAVLHDLQQILRLLREPGADDPGVGPPDDPVPRFDDLAALVASFEESGMPVRLAVTGARRSLPDAAGLTAYRVVQEALTNAHKYGDGAAELRIDFHPTTVTLDITNPMAAAAGRERQVGGGSGFGLIGMRERVRALGGTLVHGDEGKTYRVRAELPLGDHPGGIPGGTTISQRGGVL